MRRSRGDGMWGKTAVALALVVGSSSAGWAAAPPGRYTVTANTVLDTKTGFTWQRAVPSSYYNWADAKTYCTGLSLDGTGWRLPTAAELVSLVDIRRTSPAIDTEAFPSTPSEVFWSSSPYAGASSHAWVVTFDYGLSVDNDVSTGGRRVRCVR